MASAEDIRELDRELSCDLPGGGRALFMTRARRNLSSTDGEDREHALKARERLCEELRLRWLCASRQVHGTQVQRVRVAEAAGGQMASIAADGHLTSLSGIGAMVLSADCLPVALGSEGAVAMLHAGWRGLAAGVLEEGVRALREEVGNERVSAAIGPGAGLCCYEVGPEVHAVFGGAHRDGSNIDLRAIARERLLAAGVSAICEVRACTICDERFFSYRREGASAGRQGGVAWLS